LRERRLLGSLAAGCTSQLALVLGGVLAARALGAQDRGYFALILLVPHIISQIGNFGLPLAATYYIARDRSTTRHILNALALPVVAQAIIGSFVQAGALILLFSDEPDIVRTAAVLSLAILPGMLALQYGLAVLQGQQRFRAFNILRTLPTIVWALGVLVVFTTTAHTLVEIVAVHASALLVVGGTSVVTALLHVPRVSSDALGPSRRAMLRFGVRGLLGYISPLESFRLDQAVIGLFLSPTALGLYVVAVSLTNLPRFLTQSVGMVAYPDVASTSDERESRLLTRRYVGIALAVSLAVVLPLEFGADALIHFFFGSDFASATSVARILLAGTVVLGVRRVLADGARGMGYPGLGTVAEMGSWFVLIPTIVLFPSALGLNGVALALALSWCASLALLVALLARQQSIHARPASPTVIDPGNQPLA